MTQQARGTIHPQHDALGLIRLSDDDCWRMLSHYSIGRVGVVHGGAPMIFPVNYAVDGRSVVVRTAPGTKLALARFNTPAVFEIDDAFDALETGFSVMVHGTLRSVDDPDECARLQALPLRAWAPGDRDYFVRLVPEWLSGRRIPPHMEADGLGTDAG